MNGLTLYDVKQLLVNPNFRTTIVHQTKDSEARHFWRRLEEGPDNAVDSVVNKLDALVGFRALRNIVGQQSGLDMSEVVRQRKILLVPLPTAALGEANAGMLGSIIVDKLWEEIQLRPAGERYPVVLILDEFQRFLNLSVAIEDMFAQARSYQLPLIVANQLTRQLPDAVLAAVKGNARSTVAFGQGPDDAAKLKDLFAPLGAGDLQTLAQFEAAATLMTDSGPAPTATIRTLPPPRPTGFGLAAQAASMARYGRPVDEVERAMRERHGGHGDDHKRPSIGRVVDE